MTTTTPTRQRHWIGPCLLGVAGLHTLAAAVLFRPALQQMAERGLFNSVGADPRATAAA